MTQLLVSHDRAPGRPCGQSRAPPTFSGVWGPPSGFWAMPGSAGASMRSCVGWKTFLQGWVQTKSGLSSEKEPRGCPPSLQASATPTWLFSGGRPCSPAACHFGILLWKSLEPVRAAFLVSINWSCRNSRNGQMQTHVILCRLLSTG